MTREEAEQTLCNRAWTPTAATITGRLTDLTAAALAYAKACGWRRPVCERCKGKGERVATIYDGRTNLVKEVVRERCDVCHGTGEQPEALERERPPDGTPGLRDADNPCHDFHPGSPDPSNRCEGDGHYLCLECSHKRLDEEKCPVCGDPEFRCHHDEDGGL
jgi:hypothetical protein